MAVERVEGVQEASFSYDRSEGFVTYDPEMTSPEEFLAELAEMTDFRGTVRAERDEQEHPNGNEK